MFAGGYYRQIEWKKRNEYLFNKKRKREREREVVGLLDRLENLLNHFDTIHLSKKKKNFLTGVCQKLEGGVGGERAVAMGGSFLCRHTYFKQKKS